MRSEKNPLKHVTSGIRHGMLPKCVTFKSNKIIKSDEFKPSKVQLSVLKPEKLKQLIVSTSTVLKNSLSSFKVTPLMNNQNILVDAGQFISVKREDGSTQVIKLMPSNKGRDTYDQCEQLLFERKEVMLNEKNKAEVEKQKEKSEETLVTKKTNHKCQKCDQVFNTVTDLLTHKKDHVVEKYPCSICGKLFKTLANVQKHEKAHNGIRLPCNQCDKQFTTEHHLRIHLQKHSGEYAYTCDECGKGYYTVKAYRYHIESEHKGIRYKCEYCPSILRSKRYWRDHLAKHINKNLKPYTCKICHKYYSSYGSLNSHMKIHTGQKFICPVCNKKSTQRAAHIVHMRMHSGDKAFICDFCGKSFIRKDIMLVHIRRKHESSQFQCTVCPEEFSTQHKLLVHLHSHEEVEKPFQCQHCKDQFINKNFLRIHVNRIHVEHRDDPFCVKKLKSKNKTVKLPKSFGVYNESYICNFCNVSFHDINDLAKHHETHKVLSEYQIKEVSRQIVNRIKCEVDQGYVNEEKV